MNTVITKNIDGYQIVFGFSQLAIDPEGTKAKVRELAEQTPEHAALLDKKNELIKICKKKNKIIGEISSGKGGKKKLDELAKVEAEQSEIVRECNEKTGELFETTKKIRENNLEYFGPTRGEYEVDDKSLALIQKQLDALQPGYLLEYEGGQIPNNRGQKYCLKKGGRWEIKTIEKLGETIPKKAKAPADLEPDEIAAINKQLKIEQVEGLSARQKKLMKQREIESIEEQAVTMRSKLEIKGENAAQALDTVRQWTADQIEALSEIYG
jgi:hypothetical protein